jgi:hypothetical protein
MFGQSHRSAFAVRKLRPREPSRLARLALIAGKPS